MGIKGMTDRGLALPQIGQIRKGGKKEKRVKDGREYEVMGKDLGYFRVEFDEQEKKAAEDFAAAYGPQPAALRIILPFDDIDRMWDAWYEAYTAGRMVARSDGEYIIYQLDNKGDIIVQNWHDRNGNKVPHPRDGIAGNDYKGNAVKFKAVGRLKVIVPELARAAYLVVMTSSLHDISNISDQLAAFKQLNNGRIAGIPLILRRRPKSISVPKPDGTRVRMNKSLLSIEADPQWVRAKLTHLNALAMPQISQALLPEALEEAEAEWMDDDDDDAELGDPQPEPEPELQPQPQPIGNRAGEMRPYSPETLRSRLVSQAKTMTTQPKGNEAQVISMNLDECFLGDKEKRKTVMFFLTGHDSASAIDDGMKMALKKWINPTKDSGDAWHMDPIAVKEAHACYEHALKKQGQQTLID